MNRFIYFLIASLFVMFSNVANAAPDAAKLATEIKKVIPAIDSAGAAFIAVAVVAASFAIVINMIWSKGRR